MSSNQERVLEYVRQLCDAVGAIDGAYRSRQDALERKEGICAVITPVSVEPVSRKSSTFVVRDFTFQVEIVARGRVPDQTADPCRVAVHKAIMADVTFGGLVALAMEGSTEWNLEGADMNAGSVRMQYIARTGSETNTLE